MDGLHVASGWLARSQWVAYVNSIGLISIVIASGWFTQILLSLFVFCYSQRRISKAEKSAKKALHSKREKSRVKSGSANYKSNHASFSHVSNSRLGADDAVKSFRPQPFQFRQAAFLPRSQFRKETCFACGLEGHWRNNVS